jgi:hypothetical protein
MVRGPKPMNIAAIYPQRRQDEVASFSHNRNAQFAFLFWISFRGAIELTATIAN